MAVRRGDSTRCYKFCCAICGRTDVFEGHHLESTSGTGAANAARSMAWKQTTQLTHDDSRHWICAKHYKDGGSYYLYDDAEKSWSERKRIRPGDLDL